MLRSLLILAVSLVSFSTSYAEIAQGNVSIQFKLSRQAKMPPIPDGEIPTVVTTKLAFSTYKNADFIKEMGKVFNKEFSKSAKLIFTASDVSNIKYYIRDKKQESDIEVTQYIHLSVRQDVDYHTLNAAKIRIGETITGTQTTYNLGQLLLDSIISGQQNHMLQGNLIIGLRILASKEKEGESYGIPSINLTGHGLFRYPETPTDMGLIQGSIKLSGGKVLPTPKN